MKSKGFKTSHYIQGTFCALILIVLGSSIALILSFREREISTWSNELSNLTIVLAEQTDQTLLSAQVGLDGIVARINLMELRDAGELHSEKNVPAVMQILRATVAGMPQVVGAAVVSADGQRIDFSRHATFPVADQLEIAGFQKQPGAISSGIFISAPQQDGKTREWVFHLGRVLRDARGEYVGMALVAVSIDQLTDFFGRLGKNFGLGSTITLLRDDFSLMARWPDGNGIIGKKLLGGTTQQVVKVMQRKDAVIHSSSPRPADPNFSVHRLAAVRVLDRFPMIINLTVPEDVLLVNWRNATNFIIAVTAGCIAALLIAMYFVLRNIRQREESNDVLQNLTDQLPGALFQCILSPDGKVSFNYGNKQFLDFCGRLPGQLPVDGSAIAALLHPEDRTRVLNSLKKSAGQQLTWQHEYRLLAPGGGVQWHQGVARPQRLANGDIHWYGYDQNVTELKDVELNLATINKRLDILISAVPDSIFFKDGAGRWLAINDAAEELFQLQDIAWTNKTELELAELNPDFREAHLSCWADDEKTWANGRLTTFYESIVDKSGQTHFLEVRKMPVYDSQGRRQGLTIIGRDITSQTQAQEQIERLASFDSLTQLPNRRLLLDRLQMALTSSLSTRQHGALLLIDLDNFKTLNDTLGHDVGDQLLQQVAARLSASLHAGDTLARLGGDEFVVMLEHLSQNRSDAAIRAELLGEKILATFDSPFQIGSNTCQSSPSIGIALFSGDQQDTVDELLKQADIAMYQAKAAGRNILRFFDAQMQEIVSARAALEADIRHGLEQDQFRLYFQPQVDQAGQIVGAEALLRLLDATRGVVAPGDFITLAEDTGLILPLGNWVMNTACAQLAQWATRTETAHLTLAFNVSAHQFSRPDFVEQLLAALDRTGANPNLLKLEPTESLFLGDMEGTIEKMTALRKKGVRFSLDDFGTGYSSLAYLKKLPLDQLKIDQSFVHELPTDPNACAIARTIIALGQVLGLGIIAEGVETEAQRDFLAQNGCHLYQGYLFAHAVPADEFLALLRRPGTPWARA